MFVQVINGYNDTTQYKIMCRIYKYIKTTYLVRFYDIIENIQGVINKILRMC